MALQIGTSLPLERIHAAHPGARAEVEIAPRGIGEVIEACSEGGRIEDMRKYVKFLPT
ncbi:MAG: hypothetical protein JWL84_3486 [Rhodospirillales bacterium]|nr:hypothetical protein [Rhodospirillales bacterium]